MASGLSRALTSAAIKQKARDLGFDACGIAPAADLPELGFFRQWLGRGYAGTWRICSDRLTAGPMSAAYSPRPEPSS